MLYTQVKYSINTSTDGSLYPIFRRKNYEQELHCGLEIIISGKIILYEENNVACGSICNINIFF